jgi:hypothetical protein
MKTYKGLGHTRTQGLKTIMVFKESIMDNGTKDAQSESGGHLKL